MLRKANIFILISFYFFIAGCNIFPPGETQVDLIQHSQTPEILPSQADVSETTGINSVETENATSIQIFDELGISLNVPNELFVLKEPIINLDNGQELDSYLLYIQNYGYPEGPSSGDFQIYGFIQFNLPKLPIEDFKGMQFNSNGEYEYIDQIEIDGLQGYSAQFSGPRNRFVYLFYLDGHILTFAVSEPTQENKIRAEEIIFSMQQIDK